MLYERMRPYVVKSGIYKTNPIPLVETYLIHLGEQRKQNRRNENEYLHTTQQISKDI